MRVVVLGTETYVGSLLAGLLNQLSFQRGVSVAFLPADLSGNQVLEQTKQILMDKRPEVVLNCWFVDPVLDRKRALERLVATDWAAKFCKKLGVYNVHLSTSTVFGSDVNLATNYSPHAMAFSSSHLCCPAIEAERIVFAVNACGDKYEGRNYVVVRTPPLLPSSDIQIHDSRHWLSPYFEDPPNGDYHHATMCVFNPITTDTYLAAILKIASGQAKPLSVVHLGSDSRITLGMLIDRYPQLGVERLRCCHWVAFGPRCQTLDCSSAVGRVWDKLPSLRSELAKMGSVWKTSHSVV